MNKKIKHHFIVYGSCIKTSKIKFIYSNTITKENIIYEYLYNRNCTFY
ncbi:hypothetical protein BTW14_gp024 [BeAn 58058 virus]|nr:hypothetical protein BTW14_gp024 [BeAn 58058 virus]APG58215.1 hypothetical protein BAV00026 [BeAn 58058 virus]